MKQLSPAAERNQEPILRVLKQALPERGLVLEVASGSGQHSAFFARRLPLLTFQPSDVDPAALKSVLAYQGEAVLDNLVPPLRLDATQEPWPIACADAVLCFNMIHIAPWEACLGLLRGAAGVLHAGAPLVLYGPYSIDGDFTSPSNVEFDRYLKQRDARWGVRELRDVEVEAARAGFEPDRVVPMPANNHVLVFRRV
ncbi:MAG TPA: DUF938 domain-containing protein [Polyangiaceae bacterium]